ncbi:MAG: hypothetical protein K0R18_477 [Bacillales bacterium]|jgi:hypothetical protein|nr:hypothetical protein [Bacillales bacterium]
MKRLIANDENPDVRELVLKTTPAYPSFPDQHDDTFKDSDEQSYSKMMNEKTVERLVKKEEKKQVVTMTKNTRLKKIAMMPINMFQSQLDQISDKGRDVLKSIEDYKFFVDQASRVMKNDPALTEMIQGKKKNLETSAQSIYDVVFDIENMDINAIYQRQQEVTDENKNPEPKEEQKPEGNGDSLEDKIDTPKSPSEAPQSPGPEKPEAPEAVPALPNSPSPHAPIPAHPPAKPEGHEQHEQPKSRLKQKDDEDQEKVEKSDKDFDNNRI